jgi:hypothetical protein
MQQPIRTADMNPLALASLVFGILGFVALPLVGAVLALVLGWLARRQIATTGNSGFGLARAGSLLGAIWFVLALGLLLLVNLSRH